MKSRIRENMIKEAEAFDLPGYGEIPDIGLFLEQTTKYIGGYTAGLESATLTGSMISNYVKKKIIANPVKKQYNREQIATLFFIAVAKSVLSLEDIQLLLAIRRESYDCGTAYDYFRTELKAALLNVFGKETRMTPLDDKSPESKRLLRNVIIAAAHKIYLDKYFLAVRQDNEETSQRDESKD